MVAADRIFETMQLVLDSDRIAISRKMKYLFDRTVAIQLVQCGKAAAIAGAKRDRFCIEHKREIVGWQPFSIGGYEFQIDIGSLRCLMIYQLDRFLVPCFVSLRMKLEIAAPFELICAVKYGVSIVFIATLR